jgi:hypothetical protein
MLAGEALDLQVVAVDECGAGQIGGSGGGGGGGGVDQENFQKFKGSW